MPRVRCPLPEVGDADDPLSLTALALRHLEWMRVHGYTDATVEGRHKDLRRLLLWCRDRGLARANEVRTPPTIIVHHDPGWLRAGQLASPSSGRGANMEK